MNIIVTGGLGFIGSHFINLLLEKTDWVIHCIDSETYAANLTFKALLEKNKNIFLHCADISDAKSISRLKAFLPSIDYIVHFAAETHVDNSIIGPRPFVDTNVTGTFNLLELAVTFKDFKKFIHISTDEVYGAIEKNSTQLSFKETDILNPSSVYSSTKASSELIALSYYKTYDLPVCITRCCNNYGPRQNNEKLIPKVILNALLNKKIPLYGQGENIREWIHVADHCEAILKVLMHGKTGEIYNVGTEHLLSNLSLIYRVLCLLNKSEDLIEFVADRKGHDFKYSINSNKIKTELNWKQNIKFNEGLEQTIEFYKKHI